MSKAVKQWACRARQKLMEKLGGECVCCGAQSDLEFDCIEPQGSRHHRGSTDQRMCFYHKQHRVGNIQILCSRCNKLKSVIDKKILMKRYLEKEGTALDAYLEMRRN